MFLFAGLSLVLFFLIFELMGRIYMHVEYHVPGKSYGLWTSDPELEAIYKAHSYNSTGVTNDRRFRNSEDVLEPRPPGALRVIAYGGSTTYCYNLPHTRAWPVLLQDMMRERRPGGERDQVLNAGAVMWSLGHVNCRARREVPSLAPDYVLIYSGINEAMNADYLLAQGLDLETLVAEGRFGAFATNYPQNSLLHRNSLVFKLIANTLSALLSRQGRQERSWPLEPTPALLTNYLHVLRELFVFLESEGARPVFVIQIEGKGSEKTRVLTSYSRAGARLAREMGVKVVDPGSIVSTHDSPMDLFVQSGMHLSDEGSRRLAEEIFEQAFASPEPH